jgi:hypothetical protein
MNHFQENSYCFQNLTQMSLSPSTVKVSGFEVLLTDPPHLSNPRLGFGIAMTVKHSLGTHK